MALQQELGLPVNRQVPVLAMITRLVEAKGLDLVTFIMDEMMQEDVQFVVVGTGDRRYEQALQDLARRYPDKVSVQIRFSEELAHKVYAGADLFLMPSRYEACGLSQMIAMKYGTVPVVREVGGLKDSVTNFEKYVGTGNGLTFTNFNAHELLVTVKRGLSYFEEEPVWEKLVRNAFRADNSWDRSAAAYAALYQKITGSRSAGAAGAAGVADAAGAAGAKVADTAGGAGGRPCPHPGTPGHALDTVTDAVRQVIETTAREADARAQATARKTRTAKAVGTTKAAGTADAGNGIPEKAAPKARKTRAPRKQAAAKTEPTKARTGTAGTGTGKAPKAGAKKATGRKTAATTATTAATATTEPSPKPRRRKRTEKPAEPAAPTPQP